MRKVVIIGSGPAGLTAAIYTARAGLEPLVLEGIQPGGQLTQTTEVENFPGFPEGIQGPELMDILRAQAQRFGAECVFATATDVDFAQRPFRVVVDGADTVEASTVILATGASALYLGLPSEERMRGRGVSGCATCDGFFFKGKELAVVGGGDTALEEATFLTRFATKVTIVHRRDRLRASKAMQDRAIGNPKIEFAWNSVVEEVLSDPEGKEVTGLRLRDVVTNGTRVLPVGGLFLGIGHHPNTDFLAGKVELDEKGYIVLKRHTYTSVPGVFACGDVADPRYRQAISAAGTGCQAAIDAERWLEEQGA
jgi:thioredoxin reductase (NADPH)